MAIWTSGPDRRPSVLDSLVGVLLAAFPSLLIYCFLDLITKTSTARFPAWPSWVIDGTFFLTFLVWTGLWILWCFKMRPWFAPEFQGVRFSLSLFLFAAFMPASLLLGPVAVLIILPIAFMANRYIFDVVAKHTERVHKTIVLATLACIMIGFPVSHFVLLLLRKGLHPGVLIEIGLITVFLALPVVITVWRYKHRQRNANANPMDGPDAAAPSEGDASGTE